MKSRTEKTRGARVRASRARSRVEARKRAKAKIRKPRREGKPPQAAAASGSWTGAVASRPEKHRARKPERRRAEEPRGQTEAAEASRAGREGKRSKKNGRVRTLVLCGLLLVSLAALLWIYGCTGVLNVKQVEVRGNDILEESYLRSLSGITPDTHLLKMNVKQVEEALLSEPYVARAEISRRFPNTVVIEVSERHPSGAIFQNGKYALVDQEGVVLENAVVMPPGTVEIRGLQVPLLLPGTRLSGRGFASVTSLLGSLPSALRMQATAVGLRGDEGLYLEAGGTTVFYGDACDLSRKNAIVLMAVTVLVKRYKSVEYVDVTFPDHPVIKPYGAV